MKNKTIIFIKDKIIKDKTILDILAEFGNENLGFDMSNVESVESKLFVENLINNRFKLFNLKNEILSYLSLILKDNSLKSYMNKSDFLENKRELTRRKFFVASNV